MVISRVPFFSERKKNHKLQNLISSPRKEGKENRAVLREKCLRWKLGGHHLIMVSNLLWHELNVGKEAMSGVWVATLYERCIFAYGSVWTLPTNGLFTGKNWSLFGCWWGLRTSQCATEICASRQLRSSFLCAPVILFMPFCLESWLEVSSPSPSHAIWEFMREGTVMKMAFMSSVFTCRLK